MLAGSDQISPSLALPLRGRGLESSDPWGQLSQRMAGFLMNGIKRRAVCKQVKGRQWEGENRRKGRMIVLLFVYINLKLIVTLPWFIV
jgi:hypothetical protein